MLEFPSDHGFRETFWGGHVNFMGRRLDANADIIIRRSSPR